MECRTCTDRFLGCHDTCTSYLSYRKAQDKILHDRWIVSKEKAPVKHSLRKNILSTHMR